MSRRTAESSKAIRAAWNNEQELVSEGKGTRDWTSQQQQDILEKGKAYDEDGFAFQGQHMKSAEKYPEYQGEPGNIQFLTRAEHLQAHDGNWRNPTNWYFNPVTKEKINFGDGPFIPCDIIRLSESVVSVMDNDTILQEQTAQEKSSEPKDTSHQSSQTGSEKYKEPKIPKPKVQAPKKLNNIFVRGLKKAGRFVVEHPGASLEIAGVVFVGTVNAISHIRGSGSAPTNGGTPTTGSSPSSASKIADEVVNEVADIIKEANRSSPIENDVSAHRQRYHTKDGVVWRDKAAYHRGGNNDN